MKRLLSYSLAIVICGLLWWYQSVAADYVLFGGTLAPALNVVASVLTTAVLVVLIAETLIGVGLKMLLASVPTGFQRVGVYAVVGVAGFTGILAHFGVDIIGLLATSAVLTAIIGLALQPTIGGLIAGFTLHTDRVLKVGDAIILDSQYIVVTSMGWRSIGGIKRDGSLVRLSNAGVLDGTITILPRAASIRTSVTITAPIEVDPHLISRIINAVVIDLPMVDLKESVTVTPSTFRPERAQILYHVHCWVRSHQDIETVRAKVMSRVWYAFQREGISWPVPGASSARGEGGWRFDVPSAQETLNRALVDASARSGIRLPGRLPPEVLAKTGILLLYADEEDIVLPNRVADYDFLLIAGWLQGTEFEWSSMSSQTDVAKARSAQSGRRIALMDMTADLANIIGPYAEFAVQQAAREEAELDVIRDRVALEIIEPLERGAFLRKVAKEPLHRYNPGFTFTSRLGVLGVLRSDPFLRAYGPVSILATPKKALEC